jgi:hypothetical protein
MAKKTSIMLKRLKKWKGLKKEDIEKYGTPSEIKLLEGFEDEHGIEGGDDSEIPLGDPQDPTDNEMRPLGDEQELPSGLKTIPVPVSLLENIFEFLADSEESDQTTDLMTEIGDVLGYYKEDEGVAKEGFFGEGSEEEQASLDVEGMGSDDLPGGGTIGDLKGEDAEDFKKPWEKY